MMATFTFSETLDNVSLRAGGWILTKLYFVGAVLDLLFSTVTSFVKTPFITNDAIRLVLMKQMYFSGLEAVKIVLFMALVLGTVIVSQVVGLVGGDSGSLTGKVLVWVVFRELGSLLTAIIVIARSGTAIAAELGAMKLNGEIESLELMGISPEQYLILPRIIGVMAAVVVLTAYFVVTAFAGGFLIAYFAHHVPYSQFVQGILASLGLSEAIFLGIKSFVFGLCIPLICCQSALSVGTSATEIPQAATRAVINSLFTVFLFNGLITFVSTFIPN